MMRLSPVASMMIVSGRRGTCPRVYDMPPPRVLTAMPATDAALTTAAPCSALCGLTTAMATAPGSSEKSREKNWRCSTDVSTDALPTISRSRATNSVLAASTRSSVPLSVIRYSFAYALSGRRIGCAFGFREATTSRNAFEVAGDDPFAQHRALDAIGGRQRKLRRVVHRARNLESGELRAEVAEYLRPVGGTRADDHRRRHFVEPPVGNANDAHVLHAGRIADCLLDFGRRHVLAADADELLEPGDVVQFAGVVDRAEVSRAQPAVCGERIGVGFGMFEIARRNRRALHLDLADGTGAERRPGVGCADAQMIARLGT